MLNLRYIVLLFLLVGGITSRSWATFPGAKSDWHGFERFDFELDGVACRVVTPKSVATGNPWIWRARFWGHEPQTELALLEKGFHVAYCDVADLWGNAEAIRRWDRFYEYLTDEHGLSRRPGAAGDESRWINRLPLGHPTSASSFLHLWRRSCDGYPTVCSERNGR